MNKNVFKINESQLKWMISESVRRILMENIGDEPVEETGNELEEFFNTLDVNDESPVTNENGEPDTKFYRQYFDTGRSRALENNVARLFYEYVEKTPVEKLIPAERKGFISSPTEGRVLIKGIYFKWHWQSGYEPEEWWIEFYIPAELTGAYKYHPTEGILTWGGLNEGPYVNKAIEALDDKIDVYHNGYSTAHYVPKGDEMKSREDGNPGFTYYWRNDPQKLGMKGEKNGDRRRFLDHF